MKPTLKSVKKKLDKICGEIIRSKGYCERCHREDGSLQTAHIVGRANLAVRYDLENMLCLCYRCHCHFAHSNPVEFTEWLKEYYGEVKYQALRNRANMLKKWTLEELEALLKIYTTYKENQWKIS